MGRSIGVAEIEHRYGYTQAEIRGALERGELEGYRLNPSLQGGKASSWAVEVQDVEAWAHRKQRGGKVSPSSSALEEHNGTTLEFLNVLMDARLREHGLI